MTLLSVRKSIVQFCPVLDSFIDLGQANLFGEDAEAQSEAVVPCEEAVVQEAPAKRQRRKRKSKVLKEIEDEAAALRRLTMTLSEKRSAAAKARWTKRDSLGPSHDLPSASARPAAVVPLADEELKVMDIGLSKDQSLKIAQQALSFNPGESPENYKFELDVFNHMLNIVSFTSVGQSLGKDERTIRRTVRLMSALTVLHKRYRNICAVKRVHYHLQRIGGDNFRPMQFLLKDKYDIVTLRVRQFERVDDPPETGSKEGSKDAIDGKKQTVTSKLLQLRSSFHCLWKVHGRYISCRQRNPTTLVPVECETAECTTQAVDSQLGDLTWFRDTFEVTGRVSVADEHPSNPKSDWTLQQRYPWLKMVQFVCKLHKICKSGEVLFRPFPLERTGLVHTTLSFMFSGAFTKWKNAAKQIIWETMAYHLFEEVGAGHEAAQYRDTVHALYCDLESMRLSGPGAVKAKCQLCSKQDIFNGHYEDETLVDHFCRGCCRDRKHCCERACKHVDDLDPPQPFNIDKWLGPLHAFNFIGEWTSTHNLMGRAYERAFGLQPKASACAAPADAAPDHQDGDPFSETGHGNQDEVLWARPICDGDPLQPELDPHGENPAPENSLADPDNQATSWERQSTYRGNAIQWFKSKPHARFAALRQVHTIQQDSVTSVLKQVGVGWEKKELKRRAAGKDPLYRGSLVYEGEFTDKPLLRYGSLVSRERHWRVLKDEDKTHELSCATYRSAAGAAAIVVQLQQAREKCYPYKPYGMLRKTHGAQYLHACALNEDREKAPCKIPPYWLLVLSLYPSPEAICRPGLSCCLNTCVFSHVRSCEQLGALRRQSHSVSFFTSRAMQ